MIPVREANAKLCEIGATLRVQDFDTAALLVTHDSVQFYERATARRFGEWLLLWTEHSGYRFEHEDDIIHFRLMAPSEAKRALKFAAKPPRPRVGKKLAELQSVR